MSLTPPRRSRSRAGKPIAWARWWQAPWYATRSGRDDQRRGRAGARSDRHQVFARIAHGRRELLRRVRDRPDPTSVGYSRRSIMRAGRAERHDRAARLDVRHQHVQVSPRAPAQLGEVAALPGGHAAAAEAAGAADVDAVGAQHLDGVAADLGLVVVDVAALEQHDLGARARPWSARRPPPTPRTSAARRSGAACRGGCPASSRAASGARCCG